MEPWQLHRVLLCCWFILSFQAFFLMPDFSISNFKLLCWWFIYWNQAVTKHTRSYSDLIHPGMFIIAKNTIKANNNTTRYGYNGETASNHTPFLHPDFGDGVAAPQTVDFHWALPWLAQSLSSDKIRSIPPKGLNYCNFPLLLFCQFFLFWGLGFFS